MAGRLDSTSWATPFGRAVSVKTAIEKGKGPLENSSTFSSTLSSEMRLSSGGCFRSKFPQRGDYTMRNAMKQLGMCAGLFAAGLLALAQRGGSQASPPPQQPQEPSSQEPGIRREVGLVNIFATVRNKN